MGQIFNDALTSIVKGEIDYLNDTIVVLLLTDEPNIDSDTFISDLTGEITGGGYVRKTLASKTVTTDDANDRTIAAAANVQWTALTNSFSWAVTAQSTGNDATSRCLSKLPLGNEVIDGGIYDITWPTSGVFYIQNPS